MGEERLLRWALGPSLKEVRFKLKDTAKVGGGVLTKYTITIPSLQKDSKNKTL